MFREDDDVSAEAQDLVLRLLQPDPRQRMTVTAACQHRWILTDDGDTHIHPLRDPKLTKGQQQQQQKSVASCDDDDDDSKKVHGCNANRNNDDDDTDNCRKQAARVDASSTAANENDDKTTKQAVEESESTSATKELVSTTKKEATSKIGQETTVAAAEEPTANFANDDGDKDLSAVPSQAPAAKSASHQQQVKTLSFKKKPVRVSATDFSFRQAAAGAICYSYHQRHPQM